LYDLDITVIGYAVDRLKELGSALANVVNIKQARGTMYGDKNSAIIEQDYYDQILYANDTILKL